MEIALKKTERIEVIDILRGFTLLGIILVHFTEQYYAGPPLPKNTLPGIADNIVAGFIGIFISGKFFMIFSFLFGLSFFIQFNKSDQRSTFFIRFAWRLIVLFLIGFIHSLHYRGDILTIYAVLGIVLLLCYKLPDKILLLLAFLLIINVPTILTRLVGLFTAESGAPLFPQDDSANQIYYDTLKRGSYLDILRANLYEIKGKFEFQVIFGRLYITMGLFFLGLYVGRKNIFQDIALFKKLIRCSLFTMLGCVVIGLIIYAGTLIAKTEISERVGFLVGGGLWDIFSAALATIYVSMIVRLFQRDKWKNRLMVFYSVGRMGLTTYLMQTLFGVLFFFSFGFNQLSEHGAALLAAMGVSIFIFQIFFSNFWLKHFYYGPVEWLWRSLTYLKVQPFKR